MDWRDEWWFLSRFCLCQYNHWTKYRNNLLCRSWSPGSSFQDCAKQQDRRCGLHDLLVNILFPIQVVQLQQSRWTLQRQSSPLAWLFALVVFGLLFALVVKDMALNVLGPGRVLSTRYSLLTDFFSCCVCTALSFISALKQSNYLKI